MIRIFAVKPLAAGLCAVSAVALTVTGHQLQQSSQQPQTITRIIKVPTKSTTIIKRQTVIKVPKGSQVIVPPGSRVTGPGVGGILPSGLPSGLPSPPIHPPTPTPLPTPKPPTPTPVPTRTCIHPPGQKCRHLPHPTISISVSASVGLP